MLTEGKLAAFVKVVAQPHVATGISAPSALVAWFASALPVLQGTAAIFAIAVASIAIGKAAYEGWQKLRR